MVFVFKFIVDFWEDLDFCKVNLGVGGNDVVFWRVSSLRSGVDLIWVVGGLWERLRFSLVLVGEGSFGEELRFIRFSLICLFF